MSFVIIGEALVDVVPAAPAPAPAAGSRAAPQAPSAVRRAGSLKRRSASVLLSAL